MFQFEVTKRSFISENEFNAGRKEPPPQVFGRSFTKYNQTVRQLLYERYSLIVDDLIEKNPKKLKDLIYDNWLKEIDEETTVQQLKQGNVL